MDSASALICWENKILLFHRDNIPTISNPDCWGLPGGVIEAGETPIQGLKRELQEEVSYAPKDIRFLLQIVRPDGISYGYISFVCDDEALKLKLVPEIKNYFLRYKKELEKAMRVKSISNLLLKI